MCFRVDIYPHLCPLLPSLGHQSLLPAPLPHSVVESLQFKLLIFHSDCTNISRKGWGGSILNTWTSMQTPGVLLWYHYGSTVYTRPVWVKTKQDTSDLIRLAVPQRTAALSHSLVCVNESAGDVQGCFFLCRVLWVTLVSSARRFLL